MLVSVLLLYYTGINKNIEIKNRAVTGFRSVSDCLKLHDASLRIIGMFKVES